MSKRVKLQKTKTIHSSTDFSRNEKSPYWDDFNRRRGGDEMQELPQANPDVLPEMEIASPSTPQLLMGEAVSHLQGRQKEVYLLLMRESKTYEEVSEILGITRGAAQVYESRAIRFIKDYCARAIKNGRV